MTAEPQISFKIGLVGDPQIGKTSLMVKYVEGTFDDDYILTLGVNFMEKKLNIKDRVVVLNIWDLGGAKEFVTMLPLVCNDAAAILFLFDLTRMPTLTSVKEWYKQAKKFNKGVLPFLIGTKFDLFVSLDEEVKKNTLQKAREYARVMKSPLCFSSARMSINVKVIFKIVIAKILGLKTAWQEYHDIDQPILEIEPYLTKGGDDKTKDKDVEEEQE
ncbi:MAG: putative Septum-promoting GTP-binding protein 1 [Streblomastix strix]|uniref:Putative Septum-promoting GTP-binding protein 1 n=1 Tax=Streblomastix strix TaxID=222440 RepID=A0A5J4V433_9EUKA|nr:MAG: putative Septum-promoting GTP-binding protein 1 [Streblomastix strix]